MTNILKALNNFVSQNITLDVLINNINTIIIIIIIIFFIINTIIIIIIINTMMIILITIDAHLRKAVTILRQSGINNCQAY